MGTGNNYVDHHPVPRAGSGAIPPDRRPDLRYRRRRRAGQRQAADAWERRRAVRQMRQKTLYPQGEKAGVRPDFTTRLLPEITPAIPRMRELPQWVCWGPARRSRIRQQPQARQKPIALRLLGHRPIRARGRPTRPALGPASTTPAGTGASASSFARRRHHGIDLDHCRDPGTGRSTVGRNIAGVPAHLLGDLPGRTGVGASSGGKPR